MKTLLVKIYSANFNSDYIYQINITCTNNNTYLSILNKKNENSNEFIYYSLLFAFYLVINEYNDIFPSTYLFDEINISLEGDEYFYTFKKGLNSNKKTGLGSSSALIVSLLTNIFLIFNVGNKAGKKSGSLSNILTEEQMVKVLLFSLIANNYAQKKVAFSFSNR
jgi:phosphomevalonate kinase